MTSHAKDVKPLAAAMGEQLRERRLSLDLSLSEAARRASVSPSYLVAIENGTSTPSLPVLSRVAHALDLTLGGLLASDIDSAVELSRLPERDGTVLASSESLALRVAFVRSAPGETGGCPFGTDRASVVVYLRTGSLAVEVDGDTWTLQEGDSLHAQDPQQVSWTSTEGPAVAVWVVAPLESGGV